MSTLVCPTLLLPHIKDICPCDFGSDVSSVWLSLASSWLSQYPTPLDNSELSPLSYLFLMVCHDSEVLVNRAITLLSNSLKQEFLPQNRTARAHQGSI